VRLTVHRLASKEIHKAANTYDRQAHRRGDRFAEQVAHAFARIRENPNIGEQIERGERRLLLRRFPYKVIYHVFPDRVVVVAVAHHKRRDGYWRRRREAW